MFTKYFLGIQRALLHLAAEKPANVLAFSAAMGVMDTQITNSLSASIINKNYTNLFYNPLNTMSDLFEPKLLTEVILPLVQAVFGKNE